MTSHEAIEVAESSDPIHGSSLRRNPLHIIHSPVKERILYIKKNASISELSGSLGDMGTLLPILISLSVTGQVSLTASL
ncbi:12902_t:CDS:1, partial [Acaulospora colombiana]